MKDKAALQDALSGETLNAEEKEGAGGNKKGHVIQEPTEEHVSWQLSALGSGKELY